MSANFGLQAPLNFSISAPGYSSHSAHFTGQKDHVLNRMFRNGLPTNLPLTVVQNDAIQGTVGKFVPNTKFNVAQTIHIWNRRQVQSRLAELRAVAAICDQDEARRYLRHVGLLCSPGKRPASL
jgi:hypothetical protein